MVLSPQIDEAIEFVAQGVPSDVLEAGEMNEAEGY